MVQIQDPIKAFDFLFTACEKIENSWNANDFRKKVPHRIPHGEKFPIRKVQKKTMFSISRVLTRKCGWYKF